ncbi:MAG: 3'-5' exonuclease [Bifidobacterium adolescentis]
MPHAEERRLFYVAMTRCKKKLFFVVDQSRPSRFMYELHDKICPNIFRGVKLPPQCPNCGEGIAIAAHRLRPVPRVLRVHRFPQLPIHQAMQVTPLGLISIA